MSDYQDELVRKMEEEKLLREIAEQREREQREYEAELNRIRIQDAMKK